MKEKIIAQAVFTFNQKGITKSTFRDIASALSISDGHLRYYFRTKEDLVLAIFSEMDKTIASYVVEGNSQSISSPILIEALSSVYAVMYRYMFIFVESKAILETFPKVYVAYQELIKNRRGMFLEMFEQFKQEGVFVTDVDAKLFPLLFEQVFIISDNWVKYARLPENSHRTEAEQIKHYVAVTIALLLPFLNAQLKNEISVWLQVESNSSNS